MYVSVTAFMVCIVNAVCVIHSLLPFSTQQCLVVSGGQVQTTDAHDPPIEQSLQTNAFPHEAQVVSIEIPDTNGESDTMAIESSVSQASQQGLPMHDRLVPKEDGPPPYSEAYTSVQIGEHV